MDLSSPPPQRQRRVNFGQSHRQSSAPHTDEEDDEYEIEEALSDDFILSLTQQYTQHNDDEENDDDNDDNDDDDDDDDLIANEDGEQRHKAEPDIDLTQLSQGNGFSRGLPSAHLQSSILRYFSRIKPTETKAPSYWPIDSEEMVTISIRGEEERTFRLGEAYSSSQSQCCGLVYIIQKFLVGSGQRKKAACVVYRELRETFIDCPLEKKGRYAVDKLAGYHELRYFGTRVENFTPGDVICWHEPAKKRGVGLFDIAYTVFKNTCKFDTEEYRPTPTVLEVFAGAGGMTARLEHESKFIVKWAVENDGCTASSWRENHREGFMFEECATIFLEKAIKAGETGDEKSSYSFKPNHIHGSPPCQGFSSANRTGGANDEKNNSMTEVFFEIVRHFQPETVSMENVSGLLLPKNASYLKRGIASLLDMDYQVRVQLVDACRYGDPQSRKRVILMAAKSNRHLPGFIKETHGVGIGMKPVVSPKDVLKDLEEFDPEEGAGIVDLPNGDRVHDHKLGLRIGAERHKLDAVTLSCTVRKLNAIEHYSKERGLTIRELARLQSFPDRYRFSGSDTKKRGQIGNAVPCKLAEAIGKAIKESYP